MFRNALEEKILWTKQGKLWHFPVDNEQGGQTVVTVTVVTVTVVTVTVVTVVVSDKSDR